MKSHLAMNGIMAIGWWSFHIALFCYFSLSSCQQNDTDRLALISFKQSIQRDPFGVLTSWNDSLHFCNWYGVSCSHKHPGRVTALNLTSLGLAGTLAPHIGNLSFLRYIDLQNNSFHGRIPQEIGRLHRLQFLTLSNNSFGGNIPTNLSCCSNLSVLNLIDNKLVGNIPTEFGYLSKLEALGLSRNILTGIIPRSIGNLSSLGQISLRENGLTGQIPEEISQLKNLRLFIFAENNLTGKIPHGLFNISGIEVFSASFNRLHGSIPSDIGLTLPKLIFLQLSFNRFTGPIPISLSNASALKQLTLFSNEFSGVFPSSPGMLPNLQVIDISENQVEGGLNFIDFLTNCSSLQVLDLAWNSFNGTPPNSIANLSKSLIYIALSGNQLSGTIPNGIENLLNLRFFLLDSNYLSGSIFIDFKNFQQLEMLDLSRNSFTGNVPSSVGNLSLLSNFYMGFNNLYGTIPPSLGSCHNLIELELSHNILSGSIPRQVMSLSSLSISLNLAANVLSGSIPEEVGLLQNLVKLDLSDNRLSGMIPNTISRCLHLEQLHLKGNLLIGEIPQVFIGLRGLRELDVSDNKFSGRIPDSLAELDGLEHLNLSFNQLQGEVPRHGIFLNVSAVSLLGNNNLCGGITELKLPSCSSSDPRKKNFSLVLKILIPVIVTAMLVALSMCVLIFWYRKRRSIKKNISTPPLEHQFLRVSYPELFKATNGFSVSNIIGVGSYGSVYRGILDQMGREVAVKVLNLQRRGASNSFVSECQALRNIKHRNLVKLLSVCSSMDHEGNDFKALIYEFMLKGSLEGWLHTKDVHQRETRNLKLIQRLNIAIDIAFAIEYLHNGCSSTIIHGDVKPSNVLLDDDMTAHVGDFGLAKIVSTISGEAQPYTSSSVVIKGSIGYVAPEYGMGDMVSTEGDVYSYGILLLEMFTGKKPTDESFKDDINLHSFVERSLPDRVMDIVDPNIFLFEDGGSNFRDCILVVFRIGVACSMEQPSERIKISDAFNELQKIRATLAGCWNIHKK